MNRFIKRGVIVLFLILFSSSFSLNAAYASLGFDLDTITSTGDLNLAVPVGHGLNVGSAPYKFVVDSDGAMKISGDGGFNSNPSGSPALSWFKAASSDPWAWIVTNDLAPTAYFSSWINNSGTAALLSTKGSDFFEIDFLPERNEIDFTSGDGSQGYFKSGSWFLGGNAEYEPDLSCCDGPTSNGYSIVTDGAVKSNWISNRNNAFGPELDIYHARGSISSPSSNNAGDTIFMLNALGYNNASYHYLGALSFETGADVAQGFSGWKVYNASDSVAAAIYLDAQTTSATITAPVLKATSLTSTGSATGKKVVCVDTSTGQLYASSSGTDCSN